MWTDCWYNTIRHETFSTQKPNLNLAIRGEEGEPSFVGQWTVLQPTFVGLCAMLPSYAVGFLDQKLVGDFIPHYVGVECTVAWVWRVGRNSHSHCYLRMQVTIDFGYFPYACIMLLVMSRMLCHFSDSRRLSLSRNQGSEICANMHAVAVTVNGVSHTIYSGGVCNVSQDGRVPHLYGSTITSSYTVHSMNKIIGLTRHQVRFKITILGRFELFL
ncbi:hypothetical protein NPIL_438111 [Nephila pilipes]|uniref:Uncharacterized protein n=1 Tax=Nephila pilipes TaxID=299642 RepID=A0A8X6U908_NEPPI|nr:hypothetical protein NPIL_438111 [Nephila pilipes]